MSKEEDKKFVFFWKPDAEQCSNQQITNSIIQNGLPSMQTATLARAFAWSLCLLLE